MLSSNFLDDDSDDSSLYSAIFVYSETDRSAVGYKVHGLLATTFRYIASFSFILLQQFVFILLLEEILVAGLRYLAAA